MIRLFLAKFLFIALYYTTTKSKGKVKTHSPFLQGIVRYTYILFLW